MNEKTAEIIKFPKIDKQITTQETSHTRQRNTRCRKLKKIRLDRNFSHIKRANDPSKSLAMSARMLLSAFVDVISHNEEGMEFFDHNFLSLITQCRSSAQNRNILKQLANIVEYEYYNCITFQGKRRTHGYLIKFIEDEWWKKKGNIKANKKHKLSKKNQSIESSK